MSCASILAVVGTRPEAIKQAPVVRALSARGLAPTIVLTGQHPALDPAEHGLDHYPLIRLNCRSDGNPLANGEAVAAAMAPLCTLGRSW